MNNIPKQTTQNNLNGNTTIVIKRPYELNQFFQNRNRQLLQNIQNSKLRFNNGLQRFFQGHQNRSAAFLLANRKFSYGMPMSRFINQRFRLRHLLFKPQPYRNLFTSLSPVKSNFLVYSSKFYCATASDQGFIPFFKNRTYRDGTLSYVNSLNFTIFINSFFFQEQKKLI